MTEHPASYYAHAVRGDLPRDVFRPAPSRLAWLVFHFAIAAAGIVLVAQAWMPWYGALALSLVIGNSFACAAFVAHEALHGSIVRGPVARWLVGWLGFLPLAFSPSMWVAWHNKLHHGNTGREGVDPDTYPTLSVYQASKVIRVTHHITPGKGHWAGWLTLVIGFSVQSTKMLIACRTLLGFSRRDRRVAWAETLAGVAFWALIAFLVGPLAFLFGFVIPYVVGNVIMTSYILTNHTISPLTKTNDPLLNSLSVTNPRALELAHLNFGYHVEHHLFPAMSPRHAHHVRKSLVARWPERYQSMSFWQAMKRIFATSRVYADATTLINPVSGQRFPTLAPRTT